MPEPHNRDLGFENNPDKNAAVFQQGKNYVLAIGIDDYPGSTLYNCVHDMDVFVQALQSYHNFHTDNLIKLKNSEASRSSVLQKIRELNQLITSNDNFILYFAGHGVIDGIDNEGYWLLHGCTPKNYWDEGINNQDIIRNIRYMKARHILIIADSCFSGSLFFNNRSSGEMLPADRIERFPSRWAITAGRKEVVSDGDPNRHSPFAEKLIQFFNRTDHPENRFSVSELSRYIKTAVARNSQQTPDGRPLHGVGDEGGEFVFYCKNAPVPGDDSAFESFTTAPQPVTTPPELRVSTINNEKNAQEIRSLIAKANIEQALSKLVEITDDALLLQQSYNTSKRENLMGLLTNDEWNRIRNKITYAILELTKNDTEQ